MDAHLVETLTRWFAFNAFRADLSRALAIVPLVLIGLLVVLAWSRFPSNSPIGRAGLSISEVIVNGSDDVFVERRVGSPA